MASFTPGVRIIIIVSVSEAHNWRALCGSSLLLVGAGGGGVARMKWEENPADYIVVSTGKHSAEENSVIITMQN